MVRCGSCGSRGGNAYLPPASARRRAIPVQLLSRRHGGAVDGDVSFRWLEDAGADLQQSTLPASVFTHDAEGFSTRDLKAHVAQSPVVRMKAAAVEGSKFFEAFPWRGVNGVAFGNPREFDGRCGH